MKQILIATHGKMASGIRNTAELIAGKSDEITTIDAYVNQEDNLEKQFKEYFKLHSNDRIIVFTDLMGGSVNQQLMGYAQQENVSVITGMNLPVLIQVMLTQEDVSEAELQQLVQESRTELKLVTGKSEETSTGNPKEKREAAADLRAYENSTARAAALRVDDRLIHGQVAMTWTKHLRAQGIVVACDEAAGDETQKMALKMAVPAGIKVLIKPVDEAIRILNHEKAQKMRILILTRTIKDALKVKQHMGDIEFVNLGNIGRFDGIDMKQKKSLTETIMLTREEQDCLRELIKLSPDTCVQQVPNDEKKSAQEMLEKWN